MPKHVFRKKTEKDQKGPLLTSPLAPRGEMCSLGGMFTPSFTPRGEHSLQLRRMEGRTGNSTPGEQLAPGGQRLPLNESVIPRDFVRKPSLCSLLIVITFCRQKVCIFCLLHLSFTSSLSGTGNNKKQKQFISAKTRTDYRSVFRTNPSNKSGS
jgi:hypothetical protein